MESAINVKLENKDLTKSQDKTLISGILTGQAAGLIMAVVVMIVFTVFLGKNPLYPVQVIGSMAFGEPALQGYHIGAIIAGLLLHQLGPSLLWGVVFGFLAKKLNVETVSQALKLGIGVGVISMVGPYILIPTLMNTLHGVDIWNREVPMFWDWAAHIVFGAAFALYPRIKAALNA
jgi:hypothetical protein